MTEKTLQEQNLQELKQSVSDAKETKITLRLTAFRKEFETKDRKKDETKEIILSYLKDKAMKSSEYFLALLDERRTFKACLDFLFQKVSDETGVSRGVCMMTSDHVFCLLDEYFLTPFEELPEVTKVAASLETSVGAKKQTKKKEEKKKTSTSSKRKKKTEEVKESKKTVSSPTPQPSEQPNVSAVPSNPPTTTKRTSKKKLSDSYSVEGQMDIFSFL